MLVLVALTTLVLAAATAATARWFPADGRGASIVDSGLLATGFVAGPLLLLGHGEVLTPGSAAALVGGLSGIVLFVALGDPEARLRWRARLRAIGGLPAETLSRAWRARHVAFVGVVAVAFSALWTAWLAYLAPSSSWDGMWYHDSIVGFAVQHEGFAWVDVPRDLQFVNGYPKTSELLSLWLVLFWDDRLLELPASVYGPFAVVAFAVLCRRLIGDHLTAVAWGCALFLVPGVVLQLRSTYVDVLFLAVFLASAEVTTRSRMRPADVVLGGLGLGLLGGMKGTGLVLVPVLTALLASRAFGGSGRSRRALVPAAVLLVGLMAPAYVRNAIETGNPAWPVGIENPWTGEELPGGWQVDMPKPLRAGLDDVYGAFVPEQQFHDIKVGSYGRTPPYVVPVLAILGWLGALTVFVRGRRGLPGERSASTLLALSVLVVPTLRFSPAWYLARFNLHVLAVAFLAAAYALRGPRGGRAGHLAAAVLVLSGVADLARARPGWEVPFPTAMALAGQPAERRAAASITPVMGEPETLLAIERELGPGDVVAFTTEFGFPAVLWNRDFTNRLVWVHGRGARYLAALEDAGARWAVAKRGSREETALRGAEGWARVGMTSDVNVAFRRVEGE